MRLAFDVARVPIVEGELRRDAADLGDRELVRLVEQMRGEGRAAAFEAMTLYKRTAIPLNVPLLALLGVTFTKYRPRRPRSIISSTTLARTIHESP